MIPFPEGFIADFVCLESRLIIELDGGQHAEDENARKDIERSAFLEGKGFMVLRFWNNEVLRNTEGVLMSILDAANTLTPTPPVGEGLLILTAHSTIALVPTPPGLVGQGRPCQNAEP